MKFLFNIFNPYEKQMSLEERIKHYKKQAGIEDFSYQQSFEKDMKKILTDFENSVNMKDRK